MDKLKRYIECYIPTETCNLRCHYCYITQQRKFNNKLASFSQTPETIRSALSVERLGGKCLFNLCAGGETLLSEEILDVIKVLLEEGHYVMVVTNGTLTKRFDEITLFPTQLLQRLIFKFSFHYLELKRLNLLDQFFENIEKVRACGSSFTVEITPSDELISSIEDIKAICLQKLGTLCHITIARDDRTSGINVLSDYSFKEYQNIWGTFNSALFNFKTTIFYKKRKEFCYAGDWSLYVNLSTGVVRQCYCGRELDNIYDDITKPLNFNAIGYKCTLPHCYNGHAFLTLGNIPELITPTYAEMRNRVDNSGRNWLQPELYDFFNQKLAENNVQYSLNEKKISSIKDSLYGVWKLPKKILKKSKSLMIKAKKK
ncbi:MAG TPA: radical SAM protein [Sporomusaceae bacterium]|nr:radical SAM protein [Sporomusaceae bacterium]